MGPALFIHTGGIGDFLLACPALACLAADATVDLLGRPDRIRLAVAGGIVRAAHDLDAVEFHTLLGAPSPRLRDFLRGYRRVVVWMRDDDGRIRGILRACGVTDAQAFPGLPPDSWNRHASEYYLECLGYPADAPPLRLAIPPTADLDVVIHPGSGARRKNWPLEHFAELAHAFQAQGRTVTWCAGPAEETLPVPAADRLEPGSLVDLAGRLAGARLYVGNDSGITHLAAAVARPTLVLFGPTDPRVWAPRGEHVRVVQATPWPSPAEVLRAVFSQQ